VYSSEMCPDQAMLAEPRRSVIFLQIFLWRAGFAFALMLGCSLLPFPVGYGLRFGLRYGYGSAGYGVTLRFAPPIGGVTT
jgi:hypothetical protein